MKENIPRYGHNKEGNEITIIIIGVVFLLILTKLFFSYSEMLLSLWEKVYYPQAKLIAWFSTTLFGKGVNFFLGHTVSQADSLVKFMKNTPINEFSGHFCWEASKFLGLYYLFIFVPLGGYITFKTYCATQGESIVYQRFNNENAFLEFSCKNKMNLEKENAENNKNINNTENFVQANQLLVNSNNKTNKANKANKEKIMQIDTKKAFNCFAAQLGPQFTSLESLVNSSYGWVVIEILKYIPEKYRQKVVDEAVIGHCYDATVLVSLLESARTYGVVPSAAFACLKNKHSTLWYGLNNLGRKTVFAEGAGISAQYDHEVRVKKSSGRKPCLKSVMAAVKGLEEAFEKENQVGRQEYENHEQDEASGDITGGEK